MAERRKIKRSGRKARIRAVNELVKVIGSCGRRFFYSWGKERFAFIEVDSNGRVWWVDEYTGKRIFTAYSGHWRGFSNGGTLQDLVERFSGFVQTGEPVNRDVFGPWPDWICQSDRWGYKGDMEKVREAALRLKVIAHV